MYIRRCIYEFILNQYWPCTGSSQEERRGWLGGVQRRAVPSTRVGALPLPCPAGRVSSPVARNTHYVLYWTTRRHVWNSWVPYTGCGRGPSRAQGRCRPPTLEVPLQCWGSALIQTWNIAVRGPKRELSKTSPSTN